MKVTSCVQPGISNTRRDRPPLQQDQGLPSVVHVLAPQDGRAACGAAVVGFDGISEGGVPPLGPELSLGPEHRFASAFGFLDKDQIRPLEVGQGLSNGAPPPTVETENA